MQIAITTNNVGLGGADMLKIPLERLVVVSVMPCLAKKYEAARPEFAHPDRPREGQAVPGAGLFLGGRHEPQIVGQ